MAAEKKQKKKKQKLGSIENLKKIKIFRQNLNIS